jgi:hypothetical protein
VLCASPGLNEAFAKSYFPHGDAVGHAVQLPAEENRPPIALAVPGLSDPLLQIVGAVGDSRNEGLRKPVSPAILGEPVQLGRSIQPSDAVEGQGPQPVAVLSYQFWARHFFANPDVVALEIDQTELPSAAPAKRRTAAPAH